MKIYLLIHTIIQETFYLEIYLHNYKTLSMNLHIYIDIDKSTCKSVYLLLNVCMNPPNYLQIYLQMYLSLLFSFMQKKMYFIL